MARNTMEAWLRDEQGSDVIRRIEYYSVAESRFRSIPMNGATKTEPRMADMSVAVVAKGAAYGEDTAANDEVTLTAIGQTLQPAPAPKGQVRKFLGFCK